MDELLKLRNEKLALEKKIAELELKSATYKNIYDSLTEAVYILRKDGVIIDVNRGAEIMYGYSKEEFVGKTASDLSAPGKNNLEYVNDLFSDVYENGGKRNFEFWALRKSGELFFKDVIANRGVYHGQISLIVTARDSTRRKYADESLKYSEDRFRALYNNAPSCYQSLDDEGNFIDVNPTWLKTFGYTKKQIIGEKFIDFLHPDCVPDFTHGFHQFKNRKASENPQFKLRHKNGHYLDLSFEGSINYHPTGDKRQIYNVFKDITYQKNAERAIQDSEARFKSIFKHANIGVALGDKNGNVLDVNIELRSMLKYSSKELIGMNFSDFTYHDDRLKDHNEALKLKNGEIDNYRVEKRLVTKNKKIVWVDFAITGRRDLDNDISFYVVMIMDISSYKKAEKDLIQAKLRAEESDRLKSAFLANMSHEIRTPMNGILGFANLLKEPNLTDVEQKEYLNIIQKSGERMLNTVNDIIDISKIDAGQVAVEKNTFNLTEEIEQLYHFFKPEAEKKDISFYLNSELNENLDYVLTDKNKVNSILTNIIKNAIKFTEEGQININYSLSLNNFSCTITDTGIGIPEDRQKAIFNRFEQADISDSKVHEGSGLGLAIAKSYAELLNGQLSFSSKYGVGTIFKIIIPLKDEADNKPAITEPAPHEKTHSNCNLNILIAEDDDISYKHLTLMLKGIAGKFFRAKNGVELVKMAQEINNLHCILADIKMPVMNGYDACSKIRETNKTITMIAQTAYALEGEEQKALQAGFDAYVSKPIIPSLLLGKIKELTKKQLTTELKN